MVRISSVVVNFLLTFVVLTETEATEQTHCRKHEVETDCLEPCQPSCSWPDRPKCPTFTCSKGCECAPGFSRATNETRSPCMKCKNKKTCSHHEKVSSCANPCQASCSWKNRPVCSTLTCSEGCICKKNHFRETNEIDSPCVKC